MHEIELKARTVLRIEPLLMTGANPRLRVAQNCLARAIKGQQWTDNDEEHNVWQGGRLGLFTRRRQSRGPRVRISSRLRNSRLFVADPVLRLIKKSQPCEAG